MDHMVRMTEMFVKGNMEGYDSGHDWYHIDRVRRMARIISSTEADADPLIVELSALLHDLGDKKFRKDGDPSPETLLSDFLAGLGIETRKAKEIIRINRYISFSSGNNLADKSIEFMIVQDADRLDAIGAIGIARAFNYGGFRNNPIYDPDLKGPSTISHFYDKLLRLRDLMNTETGRSIAEERHRYLENFLEQFFKEWEIGNETKEHRLQNPGE